MTRRERKYHVCRKVQRWVDGLLAEGYTGVAVLADRTLVPYRLPVEQMEYHPQFTWPPAKLVPLVENE